MTKFTFRYQRLLLGIAITALASAATALALSPPPDHLSSDDRVDNITAEEALEALRDMTPGLGVRQNIGLDIADEIWQRRSAIIGVVRSMLSDGHDVVPWHHNSDGSSIVVLKLKNFDNNNGRTGRISTNFDASPFEGNNQRRVTVRFFGVENTPDVPWLDMLKVGVNADKARRPDRSRLAGGVSNVRHNQRVRLEQRGGNVRGFYLAARLDGTTKRPFFAANPNAFAVITLHPAAQ